jgi:hypothetical protein
MRLECRGLAFRSSSTWATYTLLGVQADEHGAAGLVLWALLVLAILTVLAFWFRRTGHLVTAGLFALSSVAAFVVFHDGSPLRRR